MQNSIAKPQTRHAQFISTAVTFAVPGQKEKKKAIPAYTRPIILAKAPHRPIFHGPYRIGWLRKRRLRIRIIGIMYEASTLMTLREIMALNAVVEPILMRARSKLMMTVIPIE